MTTETIVVPVDGSDAALRAVDLALKRAGPEGHILLVNVQNLALLDLGEAAAVLPPDWEKKDMLQKAKMALDPALRRAGGHGIRIDAVRENGPVAETIVRIAGEHHASEIIMGTRGLGGVRGLLLGSIATQVVHLATIPVTLVK